VLQEYARYVLRPSTHYHGKLNMFAELQAAEEAEAATVNGEPKVESMDTSQT